MRPSISHSQTWITTWTENALEEVPVQNPPGSLGEQMSDSRRRIRAFCGLLGVAGVLAGYCSLPLSVQFLRDHPGFVKRVRARMLGARFLTDDGVVLQSERNDCGVASLKMILAAHGVERSLASLASELPLTARGTSMLALRQASIRLGVPARSWAICPEDLRRIPLPAIAFVHGDHFVVIRSLIAPDLLEVDDPALGRLRWPTSKFRKVWSGETLVFDPAWAPL